MKKLIYILFFLVTAITYSEEGFMARDIFMLEGNIEVSIMVIATDAAIDIDFCFTNKSDVRVMFFDKYIRFGRYFYFRNENDEGAIIYRPRIIKEYDWRVDEGSVIVLEPDAEIEYHTSLTCERHDNSIFISNDDLNIKFVNPTQIKIRLYYNVSLQELNSMREIEKTASPLPTFTTKSYLIMEF
jgi:hypothetical protein